MMAALEYDITAAEAYRTYLEAKIAKLQMEANHLNSKHNKKERSAKGKEVADLKNSHKYVDAYKITKGLEPRFGHFAVRPAIDTEEPGKEAVETKPKKEHKKEKKAECAGLSHDELKGLEDLKQKSEKIVALGTRLKELTGRCSSLTGSSSSKKEKDGKNGCKKKTPLSAQEQKDYAELQGACANKDVKADPDLKDTEEWSETDGETFLTAYAQLASAESWMVRMAAAVGVHVQDDNNVTIANGLDT